MNGLNASLLTQHLGQSGGDGHSPRIWSRIVGQRSTGDGSGRSFALPDACDFLNFGEIAPAIAGTTGGMHGGFGYYVDTATTTTSIKQTATDDGGVIRFLTGATANHEAVLVTGGNVGSIGKLTSVSGRPAGFECRVRFGQVSNFGAAIGMVKPGFAANDALGATGAIADTDFVGFILSNSGDTLNIGYRKTGQALTLHSTYTKTIVADTWYKLGFRYDPLDIDEALSFYIDNVLVGVFSRTQVTAATFPESVQLAVGAAIKGYAAAAVNMDIDWFDCGLGAA